MALTAIFRWAGFLVAWIAVIVVLLVFLHGSDEDD